MSEVDDNAAQCVGDFLMPSLGADMDEGIITEWRVAPGDRVERGQIVVVVETDKSDIEVEIFEPGIVEELLVAEGKRAAVGVPIARISGAAWAESGRRAPVMSPTASTAPIAPIAAPPGVVRASPRARRLARLAGVDLGALAVPASGIVTGEMVVAAADTARTRSGADTGRSTIVASMSRSWAQIPHFHVTRTIEVDALLARLAIHNRSHSVRERVIPAAGLLMAIARAVAQVPEVNGWWVDDHHRSHDRIDLGVVVARRSSAQDAGGIVAPTIASAETLDLTEMMRSLDALVTGVRRGSLRSAQVVAASITVSSLGELGGDAVYGVIHPPQVALVGLGRIRPNVVARNGQPVVASTVDVTVAADHRALDGVVVSRFLARLDDLVQEAP